MRYRIGAYLIVLLTLLCAFSGCKGNTEKETPVNDTDYDTVTLNGKTHECVSSGALAVVKGRNGTPDYLIDRRADTVFEAGSGEATLFFDLGRLYTITGARIDFEGGSKNGRTFIIDSLSAMPRFGSRHTEQDGDKLFSETMYDSSSAPEAGNETAFEVDYYFARYLRVRVLPAEGVDNVLIREIAFYGFPSDNEVPRLDSIAIDGNELAGFDPELFKYHVALPYSSNGYPVLSAKVKNEGGNAEIKQANEGNGNAAVIVTSADGKLKTEYEIVFFKLKEGENVISPSDNGSINGSSFISGHEASKAIDGDPLTGWVPIPSQSEIYALTLDLGKAYRVSRVIDINRRGRAGDIYNMAIDVSVDGEHFERVYNSDQGTERGQSLNMCFDAEARYVRLCYFGINGYYADPVDVSEVEIYGY